MLHQTLRGLVGQNMGGPKALLDLSTLVSKTTAGDYTLGPFATPVRCYAFLYGAGGGGSDTTGGSDTGGGGGAAAYVAFDLAAGQTLPFTVGLGGQLAAGGDTTLTLPNGIVVRAGGGARGLVGAPGAGGVARNGELNRTGGTGGLAPNNGAAGEHGGAGGVSGGVSDAGGGGAAGFTDLGDYPVGVGVSYIGTTSTTGPGGGGGNQSANQARGANGQAFIIVRKI